MGCKRRWTTTRGFEVEEEEGKGEEKEEKEEKNTYQHDAGRWR